MSKKVKSTRTGRRTRRPARSISGHPFKKKHVPTGTAFKKGGTALERPNLNDPSDIVDPTPVDYARLGIEFLNTLNTWRPAPDPKRTLKRRIVGAFLVSIVAIALVLNTMGSRYVGRLPPAHPLREPFCQFLAGQAMIVWDTAQYAIIARCAQTLPKQTHS